LFDRYSHTVARGTGQAKILTLEYETIFESEPCVGFLRSSTCFHTWARGDEGYDVVLIPETEEVPVEDIDLGFEFTVFGGSYSWYDTAMMRRYRGNWQSLPMGGATDDGPIYHEVTEDGSETFTLSRPHVDVYTDYGGSRPFGGGLFAFGVAAKGPAGTITAMAFFRVVGETLTLGVPDRVQVVRDGATTAVTHTGQSADDRTHRVTYETVDDPSAEPMPVAPELAATAWDVGVPLALLARVGIERVVVETGLGRRNRRLLRILGHAEWNPGSGWNDPTADGDVFSYERTAFTFGQHRIDG